MRVVVVGSSGLVGSALCARLLRDGHEVIAVQRTGRGPQGVARLARLDISDPEADWRPVLDGADAVVNCAGALQDSGRDKIIGVHATGAAALFGACEAAGVRRVIHFSAIGVDRAQPSAFSRSKLQGDMALMERNLDWVILRPSVILGRPVFGASALIRGLAALPVVPVMPASGPLQVVRLEDVVATVVFFLAPEAPARVALELAGPERLSFAQVVARHRRWLGFAPAREVRMPGWLATILYRLGDFTGHLGWRPAVRSTAQAEIQRGATGDPRQWTETTGIAPRSLDQALREAPATVQEKWFASLYFVKPAIFVVLPLFWILTGIISLTIGFEVGRSYLIAGGAGWLSAPRVIAGALADIVVGAAIAWRPTVRLGLWAGIGMSLFYAVAGTVVLPELWTDPIGPMLKIWPILLLHVVGLAIRRAR